MTPEASLQRLRHLCREMPPVRAMGIGVAGYGDGRLRLAAPLSANVNDKGTAFGGSLVSLMTLAGWGVLTLRLQEAGIEADVFVADSQVRYLAPLYHDLEAEAELAEETAWPSFMEVLRQRGRARIELRARVFLPDGGTAADMGGRYAAIVRR